MARILFVSSEGMVGGAETSLLLLIKYLRAGFSVAVACPAPSPLSRALHAEHIDVHDIPARPAVSFSRTRYGLYALAVMRRLRRIIVEAGVDLVHANSFYAGAAALGAARTTRRPVVLHARDLADFGILTWLLSFGAERIIAVSRTVKRALTATGAAPTKIDVVYNGFDIDACRPPHSPDGAPTRPKPQRNGNFVFAHVGQFIPWKNHRAFLEAAAYVARRLPRSRFAIVGDDLFGRDASYKATLRRAARTCSAAEKIQFWGWRTTMEAVWPEIDCLVHPATGEPFGRVIVEAMAHQVPVIAVATGGPAEIIRADRTGVLVPTPEPRALGEAMLRMARDNEFAATIAAAGYRRALSTFTAGRTAGRVRRIYNDILSR